MRKVQQKQWQIFCEKVLRKLVWLGYQRVTIDPLFPFNGAGGFGADIVYYAVDPVDFIDDSVGKVAEQLIRKMSPICRHAIRASNRTNGNHAFISA